MELRVTYGFPSTLPGTKPVGTVPPRDPARADAPLYKDEGQSPPQDKQVPGTRLLDESREETKTGLRRTRIFEQPDGRTFTRVEEIGLTPKGARRTVIQQNPSGGITRYEEVLDREESGTFRRTQRFQNESGDVTAQVTPGYQVRDPFVLTQGYLPLSFDSAAPFTPSRGTQLDLSA